MVKLYMYMHAYSYSNKPKSLNVLMVYAHLFSLNNYFPDLHRI